MRRRFQLAARLFAAALLLSVAPLPPAATLPTAVAVASAHPAATRAGHQVLAAGGNAFDAAVAVTAVLAVTEPFGSGLGGGGFWLLHRASDGVEVMIDGRETAPLAATRDMYLDASGAPVPGLSIDGALAAGIPGTPAALAHLARHYGKLPLAQTLAPAIRLAQEGFAVGDRYVRLAGFRLAPLSASAAAKAIFLDRGKAPEVGWRLRQPDLARTLEQFAARGHDGFYRGPVAEALVTGNRQAGGIWSSEDLAHYRVVEREPVRGTYRGVRITSASLPSSGGIVLLESLNILSGFELGPTGDVDRTHRVVEAMRRAYRDRAAYLGDADFVDVPVRRLLSSDYADTLRAAIDPTRAMASGELPALQEASEGRQTTHFSILDRDGNRVAATMSLNYPFGSGFAAPGTGVLLNDEMDDFSMRPGVANVYGLVGNSANAIAPGKRMLSSMSPTFLDDGERVALLGTPGGSRIISMVLLATLEFVAGAPAERLVALPRFHHQYLPDRIQLEPGAWSSQLVEEMARRGHAIDLRESPWGNMQAIVWQRRSGVVEAASDPRGEGQAVVR